MLSEPQPDLVGYPVPVARKDYKVIPEQPVHKGHRGQPGPQDKTATMARMDNVAKRVPKVPQERMVTMGHPVQKEIRVTKVIRVKTAPMELMELKAHKGRRGRKDPKVIPVQKVIPVTTDKMDKMANAAHKDRKGRKAHPAKMERMVKMEVVANKDHKGPLGPQVKMERMDRRARKEIRVTRAIPVTMAKTDNVGYRVLPVPLVEMAPMVNVGQPVPPDQLVRKVTPVQLAQPVPLVPVCHQVDKMGKSSINKELMIT